MLTVLCPPRPRPHRVAWGSSPAGDQTLAPAVEAPSPNPWDTREVPRKCFLTGANFASPIPSGSIQYHLETFLVTTRWVLLASSKIEARDTAKPLQCPRCHLTPQQKMIQSQMSIVPRLRSTHVDCQPQIGTCHWQMSSTSTRIISCCFCGC